MRRSWTSWSLVGLPGPLRSFRRGGAAKLPLWHRWFPSQKGGHDKSTPDATPSFMTEPSTQTRTGQWLDDNAISYVAISKGPYDWAATDEAALVRRGLPYLQAVWSDATWTLYAVTNPRPVISTPGRVIARDRRFPHSVLAPAG